MKQLFCLLVSFSVFACAPSINEEVEAAASECKIAIAMAMEEVEALQNDACLTKEEIVDFFTAVLQTGILNNSDSSDAYCGDAQHPDVEVGRSQAD
jgi:hypothetical protein